MKTYSPGLMTCPKLLILNSKLTKGYYRVIELSIKGEERRERKGEKGEKGGFTSYMYRKRGTALPLYPDA
jgi:hypothetical protein